MSSTSAMPRSSRRFIAASIRSSTRLPSPTNRARPARSSVVSPFIRREDRAAMDTIYELAELSANGALVGLMYSLVALGIVLVFKSSGVANLAQGALAMLGGYLAWAALVSLGAPVWAGIPLVVLL